MTTDTEARLLVAVHQHVQYVATLEATTAAFRGRVLLGEATQAMAVERIRKMAVGLCLLLDEILALQRQNACLLADLERSGAEIDRLRAENEALRRRVGRRR
jgi:hypothetical protein